FSLHSSRPHRATHSFPTRRSSDLCDMSVRMQGSVEEVRVRAAIMTLANCSISWSDELTYLPSSRIRLMQQCMPPGNPPMRPLDIDRKSTRLNSSHVAISYAVFCLK